MRRAAMPGPPLLLALRLYLKYKVFKLEWPEDKTVTLTVYYVPHILNYTGKGSSLALYLYVFGMVLFYCFRCGKS